MITKYNTYIKEDIDYDKMYLITISASSELCKISNIHLYQYDKLTDKFRFKIDYMLRYVDTADEPSLYDSIKVDIDGKTKYSKYDESNPPIYHHKWLFVKDDYKGFDVEKSKERSQKWLTLKDIDFSRIGFKKFWDNFIANQNF